MSLKAVSRREWWELGQWVYRDKAILWSSSFFRTLRFYSDIGHDNTHLLHSCEAVVFFSKSVMIENIFCSVWVNFQRCTQLETIEWTIQDWVNSSLLPPNWSLNITDYNIWSFQRSIKCFFHYTNLYRFEDVGCIGTIVTVFMKKSAVHSIPRCLCSPKFSVYFSAFELKLVEFSFFSLGTEVHHWFK